MPMIVRSGNSIPQIILRMVWIVALIFSASYSLCAQKSNGREGGDSIPIKPPINQTLLHNFHTDTILPLSMFEFPINAHEFVHQSLTTLPTSLSSQFQQQVDVVSPWKQELIKQNELRTLRTVLGVVQTGGTAFLLYEHIRKYGLK